MAWQIISMRTRIYTIYALSNFNYETFLFYGRPLALVTLAHTPLRPFLKKKGSGKRDDYGPSLVITNSIHLLRAITQSFLHLNLRDLETVGEKMGRVGTQTTWRGKLLYSASFETIGTTSICMQFALFMCGEACHALVTPCYVPFKCPSMRRAHM